MVTEADVEATALSWLSNLGWQIAYGPDIASDTLGAERTDFTQVVLEERLRTALLNLNPGLPQSALETGLRQLINPEGPTPEARNRSFHSTLVNGVTVPVRRPDGTTSGEPANVVAFENPANNNWLGRQPSHREGEPVHPPRGHSPLPERVASRNLAGKWFESPSIYNWGQQA